MSEVAVTCLPVTVLLTLQAGRVQGLSLPEKLAPMPRLRFKKGTPLGVLTGQRQTDGEGNTNRLEVECSPLHLRLLLFFGHRCLPDPAIRQALRQMRQRGEKLLIWVKPCEVAAPAVSYEIPASLP